MRILVGTSGYAFREWKGSFYPHDLQEADFLAHYATRLPAVEINNTFYRMPASGVVASWYEETPDGFIFALKASQRITHQQRLKDSLDSVAYLFKVAAILREKLGPVLFQLPPFMRKDTGRLRDFLAILPQDCRAVFEFRHESWLDSEVFATLTQAGAALCCGEPLAKGTALLATTDWGYLRLDRANYTPRAMEELAEAIALQPWREAFVFFKDEGQGPALAQQFKLVSAGLRPDISKAPGVSKTRAVPSDGKARAASRPAPLPSSVMDSLSQFEVPVGVAAQRSRTGSGRESH